MSAGRVQGRTAVQLVELHGYLMHARRCEGMVQSQRIGREVPVLCAQAVATALACSSILWQ